MVATGCTAIIGFLKFAVKDHLSTAFALNPKVVRHVFSLNKGFDLWQNRIGDPVHAMRLPVKIG